MKNASDYTTTAKARNFGPPVNHNFELSVNHNFQSREHVTPPPGLRKGVRGVPGMR